MGGQSWITQKPDAYMKEFFERRYAELSTGSGVGVSLPFEDEGKEMWADGVDPDAEWKKWKLVPASISERKSSRRSRKALGVKLPMQMKAFLTTYHHCFEAPVGENPTFDHFAAVKEAWNPLLVRCGYLPFTWDEEGAYIRCIDLKNMPDEDGCGVFEIDHEILFSFDEETAGARRGRGTVERCVARRGKLHRISGSRAVGRALKSASGWEQEARRGNHDERRERYPHDVDRRHLPELQRNARMPDVQADLREVYQPDDGEADA